MSTIRKKVIILCVFLFVLISSGLVVGARLRVVVLANSIDYELASDIYGFLANKGMEVIHINAVDFEQYKQEKFIVILGGPDAYDGVGEIVQGVLKTDEQDYLRIAGNRKTFTKTNIWTKGQRVSIMAGSDRDKTHFAYIEGRSQLRDEILQDFRAQQAEIESEQRNLSISGDYEELLNLEGVDIQLKSIRETIVIDKIADYFDVYNSYDGPENEKYYREHPINPSDNEYTKMKIYIDNTLDEELDFILTLQDINGNYYIPYVQTKNILKVKPKSELKTRTVYLNPRTPYRTNYTLTVVLYGKDKRTYEIKWYEPSERLN